ncbi:MAG: hypothetical protein ABMA64_04665 [Myxococcota bacterium]
MLQWIAMAAAAEPSAEVIVYGDPFARWRGTRWLVQSDLVVPLGMIFSSDENTAFSTHMFQLRAVLACDIDGELSKKRAEVGCEVEDLAILPTSLRDWSTADQQARVNKILQTVDAQLTGITVQLQVDEGGGVTDFDLEGRDPDNLRERTALEAQRMVVARMVSGFHLRVPEAHRSGGEWAEYRSALMDMGSLVGSRGTSTLVHRLSSIDGKPILQSVGEGSAAISVPSYARSLTRPEPRGATLTHQEQVDGAAAAASKGGLTHPTPIGGVKVQPEGGASAPTIPGMSGFSEPVLSPPNPEISNNGQGNALLIEATYSLSMVGVGVFDHGVLTERVWVVTGEPTPSSPVQTPYLNRGRLVKLAPDDRPDLGPSVQVAYPGYEMDGLAPYPPL